MDVRDGPPREGIRGGLEQFSFDSIKDQSLNDRECYLGQSVKIGIQGKFGQFNRHDWWSNKRDHATPITVERDEVRKFESQLMGEALGLNPEHISVVEETAAADAENDKSETQDDYYDYEPTYKVPEHWYIHSKRLQRQSADGDRPKGGIDPYRHFRFQNNKKKEAPQKPTEELYDPVKSDEEREKKTRSGEGEGKKGKKTRKGEGESKGKGEGENKGKGEGESKGKGEGETKGKGEGETTGKGEGETNGKGEGETNGKGEGETKGKGEGQTKGKGDGETKGKGEGQTKGKGEGESKRKGQWQRHKR